MLRITKVARLLFAASLASVSIAACGGGDDGGGGGDDEDEPSGEIQVFSWWTSPGEVDALGALIALQEANYPETRVRNLAEELADEARARLAELLAAGTPPDLYQANVGADEFRYVLFNGMDDSDSKVEPLNALMDEYGWYEVLPEAVVDTLSYRGTAYSVPVNVHRINSLFYNKRILADEGLSVPETADELLVAAAALADEGYTPLCIGSSDPWTLALLVFENVFPALAGAGFYTSYWTGKENPESRQIDDTLEYVSELWPYFNADANSLDWTSGVDLMFEEESPCVMTVMGDWAKGYLETKGWVAGEDFDQAPFPGSVGTFVFTSDSFLLPKGAPHRAAAVSFLETMASVDAQIAFNVLKGSIPVRTDIDPAEFDETTQRTMRDFTSDELVVARSGLVPSDAFADLNDSLQSFVSDGDTDAVKNALANDYATLELYPGNLED
jgi:glucose/mannose transport system substrate-binding protein